jgi:alcohol dehydrogenase class IV
MYGISHGHAVALGLIPCWKELEKNSHDDQAIKDRLSSLAKIFGVASITDSISVVEKLIKKMDLPKINIADEDLEILASSVNPERLQNNPVVFSKEILFNIYRDIKGENDNE